MANLKLKNPAGGSLNFASADGASDLTVTFPATTGTAMVSGNMPAFSVYKTSVQTLSAGTWTKLDFQVEEFDTNSNFASSRFTPTVAGYYQINGAVANGLNTQTISSIYKNGSIYKAGVNYSNGYAGNVSSLVYLNGTTDYIELYGYFAGGGNSGTGIESNYFNGIMVRAA